MGCGDSKAARPQGEACRLANPEPHQVATVAPPAGATRDKNRDGRTFMVAKAGDVYFQKLDGDEKTGAPHAKLAAGSGLSAFEILILRFYFVALRLNIYEPIVLYND